MTTMNTDKNDCLSTHGVCGYGMYDKTLPNGNMVCSFCGTEYTPFFAKPRKKIEKKEWFLRRLLCK